MRNEWTTWGAQLDELIAGVRFDVKAAAATCEQVYRNVENEEVRSVTSAAIGSLRQAIKDPRDKFCVTVSRNRCIAVRSVLRRARVPA